MASSPYAAPYAAGISALTSVMGDIAATKAFKTQLDAKLKSQIASMKSATTSFELEQMKMGEQIQELNEVLGDKLSARGLQAIRNEATLKAAAAETGTAGGTTDVAIQQAYLDEHFDRANIISASKSKQKGIMRSMDISTERLRNDLRGIASGMPSVKSDPLTSALSGGLNVFTGTLGLMPESEKADLFGILPKGD